MKKILTLATAALLISGVSFAGEGAKKTKTKKAICPKGKTCGKSCSKNKSNTTSM